MEMEETGERRGGRGCFILSFKQSNNMKRKVFSISPLEIDTAKTCTVFANEIHLVLFIATNNLFFFSNSFTNICFDWFFFLLFLQVKRILVGQRKSEENEVHTLIMDTADPYGTGNVQFLQLSVERYKMLSFKPPM